MKKENKNLELIFLGLFLICCIILNNMYMMTLIEQITNTIK